MAAGFVMALLGAVLVFSSPEGAADHVAGVESRPHNSRTARFLQKGVQRMTSENDDRELHQPASIAAAET
jgi:hypothetical protein